MTIVDRTGRPVEPRTSEIWFRAIRYSSFTASVIPILVGSTVAIVDQDFTWWLCLLMIGASVACHAGANLTNDYFDDKKGVDTRESLGPGKVIQQGLLTARQVKRGMYVAFAIATLLGVVIVLNSDWRVFLIAILSLGAAYFYTAGSRALGYIALGEITVLIFMGPVMVCGAYYVLAERFSWESLLISIPIGLLAAAILHVNNLRDINPDREAGKETLATLLGAKKGGLEYAVLVAGAYLVTVASVVVHPSLWPLLIVAISAPLAMNLVRSVRNDTCAETLNKMVRKTAGLHLEFGALVIAGLLLRAFLDRI